MRAAGAGLQQLIDDQQPTFRNGMEQRRPTPRGLRIDRRARSEQSTDHRLMPAARCRSQRRHAGAVCAAGRRLAGDQDRNQGFVPVASRQQQWRASVGQPQVGIGAVGEQCPARTTAVGGPRPRPAASAWRRVVSPRRQSREWHRVPRNGPFRWPARPLALPRTQGSAPVARRTHLPARRRPKRPHAGSASAYSKPLP
jgi:hypothetical protein